jgi:hypothetical protein
VSRHLEARQHVLTEDRGDDVFYLRAEETVADLAARLAI